MSDQARAGAWLASCGFKVYQAPWDAPQDITVSVEPRDLVSETNRLKNLLLARGVVLRDLREAENQPGILGCFLPVEGLALITITNILDL